MKKYKCPVCGKFTLDREEAFEICDVCGWEDDPYQRRNPDEDCCANQISLNQAKQTYLNCKAGLM